jgi:GNAT superfamily N-acetyltransferase
VSVRAGGSPSAAIVCRPATAARWKDVEALFGEKGACAGCWCMWPRLRAKEFGSGRGEGNKRALRALVRADERPGLIAYRGRTPVGWCAVAPREAYARLATSRVMAPVDERPVWSLVCFFVAKEARGQGVTRALIRSAVAFAARNGARIIEAYPHDAHARMADTFAWFGVASAFRGLGFREVARRSATRPVLRHGVTTAAARRSPARG